MTAENIKNTKHRFSDVIREPCIVLTPIRGYSQLPLVSLEEATERLKDIVSDIEVYVHVAKTRADTASKSLPVDESAAIALYTMEWEPYDKSVYYILNATLRTEDRSKLKPWFLYLKLMLTALSKLNSVTLTVFRGMKSENSIRYDKYEVGKELIWWGFSSCSKDQNVAEREQFAGDTGQRTLFIIECINGKDISKHSYYRREKEILLLPATSVQVISKEVRDDGVREIRLREIDSPYKYLEDLTPKEIPIEEPDVKSAISDGSDVDRSLPERNFNRKLLEDLSRFRVYAEVYLFGRRLNTNDMKVIAHRSIIENKCRGLFLRESSITSEGANIIANALSSPNHLERLFISHNRIGDAGTKALAKALRNNTTLKELCLGHDSITDDGIQQLADTLKFNKTLTHLWLPSNKISDKGLKYLAVVLTNHNETLQVLSLEWNKFSSETSVDVLIGVLTMNKSLTSLNLNNCRLPRISIKILTTLARNRKNFSLTIH